MDLLGVTSQDAVVHANGASAVNVNVASRLDGERLRRIQRSLYAGGPAERRRLHERREHGGTRRRLR